MPKVKKITEVGPSPEQMWVVVNFAQSWNTWAKALERSLRPGLLTVSQVTTLQALYYAKRPLSPTEISHVLPLETHSVSPLLDRLHKRKIITRRRSKTDRRAVEVEMTPKGLTLLTDLGPGIRDAMERVFYVLSPQEREMLVKLTEKISNAAVDYLGANKEHLAANARMMSGLSDDGVILSPAKHKKAKRKKSS
ncbi:MAG: MarR family winged helix-turn-helix transcriptional regulator [Dehalococcoidia bacterium]|nr:MarR family winged helix-turn-helix transcriptional regulator [Dehalococcoidia bacterium]MDD5648160.1 MarR family winged helix-turn-helix transcriptional regulator [Dehalococcoidia bacterium]